MLSPWELLSTEDSALIIFQNYNALPVEDEAIYISKFWEIQRAKYAEQSKRDSLKCQAIVCHYPVLFTSDSFNRTGQLFHPASVDYQFIVIWHRSIV